MLAQLGLGLVVGVLTLGAVALVVYGLKKGMEKLGLKAEAPKD